MWDVECSDPDVMIGDETPHREVAEVTNGEGHRNTFEDGCQYCRRATASDARQMARVRKRGRGYFSLQSRYPFGYQPMPRIPRGQVGGHAYHVLNRGNGGVTIFHKDGDYAAFLDLLAIAKWKFSVKKFGVCLMPNHFHLVL